MIRLEKICYAYEKEVALRYVNLQVEKGDSLVIQGPNGCGKSTLIKLLNGILFPSEGSYHFQGHEITEKALKNNQFAKWFHQQMGYVFQNADTQLFCGCLLYTSIPRKFQQKSGIAPDVPIHIRSLSPTKLRLRLKAGPKLYYSLSL